MLGGVITAEHESPTQSDGGAGITFTVTVFVPAVPQLIVYVLESPIEPSLPR